MRAALELHKEVIQGLQTIDAFSQDLFLPEEIDFHLNKQQDSLVNELLDRGFSDRQLRLDYTQDLIVKNKKLDIYLSPTAFYYESGAVISFLPGDYKHLLDARVEILESTDCKIIKEEVEPSDVSFYKVQLKTSATTPPYYSTVQIVKEITTSEEEILAEVSAPIEEVQDTYLLVRNLLYKMNKQYDDLEMYWEKYTDSERQGNIDLNHFIIRSSTPGLILYLRVLDASGGTTDETLFTEQVQKMEKFTGELLATLKDKRFTSTVILDNKELYSRQQNSFFLTKSEEPHTSVADGLIFNYYGDSFLIDNVLIDYIREPQPISLAKDQGCELSISASHLIANRTIEYLKLAIENPSYREFIQHNEIRDSK